MVCVRAISHSRELFARTVIRVSVKWPFTAIISHFSFSFVNYRVP